MKSIFNKLVGDKKDGKVIKVGAYQVHIVKQVAEGMQHAHYPTQVPPSPFYKGGFSFVFLCKDNQHKHYALKRVLTHDDEELLHVQQEAAVMVFHILIFLQYM